MTIYVLEGPDFAGKTTLAKSLHATLTDAAASVNVIHNVPPTGQELNLFGDYVEQVGKAASDPFSSHTIFDRLHVGELIYGPIYRQGSMITDAQAYAIDDMLDQLGAVKVFVDAPEDTLLERFNSERGDDLVQQQGDFVSISRRYRGMLMPAGRDDDGYRVYSGTTLHLDGWVHWTPGHAKAAGLWR